MSVLKWSRLEKNFGAFLGQIAFKFSLSFNRLSFSLALPFFLQSSPCFSLSFNRFGPDANFPDPRLVFTRVFSFSFPKTQ